MMQDEQKNECYGETESAVQNICLFSFVHQFGGLHFLLLISFIKLARLQVATRNL